MCLTGQAEPQHHPEGDALRSRSAPGRSGNAKSEACNEQDVESNIAERDQKPCQRHETDLAFNA